MSRRAGVVFALVVLVLVHAANSSLVAYYDFDGDLTGTSGYCQNTVPTGKANSGSGLASTGRYGSSFDATGSNYMTLDGLNLFPGSTSSAFSVSAWIKLTSSSTAFTILRRDSFLTLQIQGDWWNSQRALYCSLYFSTSVYSSVSTGSVSYSTLSSYWTHVSCVYNTTHLCTAYNGTSIACKAAAGQQVSPSSNTLTVSYSSNPLRGYLDELKFFDHALTAQQLQLLVAGVAANDAPSAAIVAGAQSESASLSAPALTTLQVSVTGSDARLAYSGAAGTQISYSWSLLSSVCGIAELSNSTSAQPSISIGNELGSFVLSVCATDGEQSTYATAQVQVTASEPVITSQTEGPILDVPLGYVNYPVSVEAGGVPEPTYQWQYLTLENATLPDTNSTTDNTTTTGNATMARRAYGEMGFARDDAPLFAVRWIDTRAFVEVWTNIDGASSSVYRLNGTMENNNQSIRCLVINTGGETYSDTYVVRIAAAQSPSANPLPGGASGDSVNVGAIVGGAVGGGAALLCLLLLLVALLALVLARRRNDQQRKMRKLTQPDYAALAYGDVENHYDKLEKLLLAENGRIAHAMFVSISPTDAEKACKAVMRVFEANGQGYSLLERRISDEVAMAGDEGTLFRSNSIAAKLFGSYVRMTSLPFIWYTLVASVNSLNDNAIEAFGTDQEGTGGAVASRRKRYQIDDDDLGSGSVNMDVFASGATTMEIDPHKVGDEASDTTINSLELWLVAQKLFKCIVDSERIMPTQIKQLMHHIDSEVGSRFSAQAQFRALGGFLFLRMVCPALMAPQVYGLLDAPPHPVAQRQFILVSKVLQNLANDTLPGAKEAYMEQLNSFILTNKAGLERFYEKVLSGTDRGKPAESEVPAKARQASLVHLHRYLSSNLQAIEQDMKQYGSEELVAELREVLAQLGDDTNV